MEALCAELGPRFRVYWVRWQTHKTLQTTAVLADQPIIGVESAAESAEPLTARP